MLLKTLNDNEVFKNKIRLVLLVIVYLRSLFVSDILIIFENKNETKKHTCIVKVLKIGSPKIITVIALEWYNLFYFHNAVMRAKIQVTVIILNIGTDRSEQTVQTQISLLLMEQSDQGLLCLLFCLHLLNTILHCKIQLFQM